MHMQAPCFTEALGLGPRLHQHDTPPLDITKWLIMMAVHQFLGFHQARWREAELKG